MCRKTMDIRTKHLKSDCLRRIVSPGSRPGWRLLRVAVEQEQALRLWRSSVVKATIRKYVHQEKKRAQLSKLTKTTKDTEKLEKTDSICEETKRAASVENERPPPGAMAPKNTTQYLMDTAYEDMLQHRPGGPHVSAQRIDETLDSYDACLAFQQRDFEEHFGMLW